MCYVVHLLWNLILDSYVVCSFILEFDFQTNFKFNNVYVLCSSISLIVADFELQLDFQMNFKYNIICVLCVCLLH